MQNDCARPTATYPALQKLDPNMVKLVRRPRTATNCSPENYDITYGEEVSGFLRDILGPRDDASNHAHTLLTMKLEKILANAKTFELARLHVWKFRENGNEYINALALMEYILDCNDVPTEVERLFSAKYNPSEVLLIERDKLPLMIKKLAGWEFMQHGHFQSQPTATYAECMQQAASSAPPQAASSAPPQTASSAPQQISIAFASFSMECPQNYMVQQGALVQDVLRGMLGPVCDENRDAAHKLELKIQELHAQDPAKAAIKVEMWMFQGDGSMWVNVAAFAKYLGMDANNNLARTLKRLFDGGNIPHKLLQVPGVRTTFLF